MKIVIDTETTWYDEVMSIGAVVADSDTMSLVETKYYIIDPESFCLKKNGVRVKLRPKELELLIYLAKRRGQIISAEELYSAIWGNGHGDISTIPVHIRRIRDRLETNSSFPEFLKTVYGKGYYLQ